MTLHRNVIIFSAFGAWLIAGCGGEENEVPGRVALEVTLTIDDQPAESGTLILRPDTGVACPLVMLPIADGKGSLPTASGPVPGNWTAMFRSDSEGSLSDQLEESGRSNPLDQTTGEMNPVGNAKDLKSPKSTSVSIPDGDPAVVEIKMRRS